MQPGSTIAADRHDGRDPLVKSDHSQSCFFSPMCTERIEEQHRSQSHGNCTRTDTVLNSPAPYVQ